MACVLIIEDDPDSSEALQTLLALEDIQSKIATESGEATQLVRSEEISVVVMDYRIEGIDHKVLASLAKKRNVEVILVSGTPDIQEVKTALGLDFAFQKPYEPERLLQTIRRLVKAK